MDGKKCTTGNGRKILKIFKALKKISYKDDYVFETTK